MRRRALVTAILVVGVAAVTLQASCGTRNASDRLHGSANPRAKAKIPERYSDWRFAYSTGGGDVFSAALDGAEPNRLFSASGLDTSTLLQPVEETSELLYERLHDGRIELLSFSFETGRSTSLVSDVSDFVSVDDGSAFYVIPDEHDRDALWERNLATGESRIVAHSAIVADSVDTSGPAIFGVARSDRARDSVDQDLFTIEDGRPVRVSTAKSGFAHDRAFAVPTGILYAVVQQGGEQYGSVFIWSRGTHRVAELEHRAAVMDVAKNGSALLLLPLGAKDAGTSDDAAARSGRLVLVSPDGESRKPLGRVFHDYPLARIAGDKIVVAFTDDGRQRLSVFESSTGTEASLHDDARVRVSEIEPLDGDAVLCVLDRLGADGLPRESELAFVPLTANESRVSVARDTSGFIHMSAPLFCPD